MTNEANRLLDAAVKRVGLRSSFSPAEIGEHIGMDKLQAEAAARHLSNAGILELGFDCSATFSHDYKKMRAKDAPEPSVKKTKPTSEKRKKSKALSEN